MHRRFPLLIFGALFVSFSALSGDVPNLSGEWKMNPAKSDFGAMPAPEVLTRVIKHSDPSLQITTHRPSEISVIVHT